MLWGIALLLLTALAWVALGRWVGRVLRPLQSRLLAVLGVVLSVCAVTIPSGYVSGFAVDLMWPPPPVELNGTDTALDLLLMPILVAGMAGAALANFEEGLYAMALLALVFGASCVWGLFAPDRSKEGGR